METITMIPTILWYSSALVIVTCISAIVLSIQNNFRQQQRQHIQLPIESTSFLETDSQRDGNIPFADTNRLGRLILNSLASTIIAALKLIIFLNSDNLDNSSNEDINGITTDYGKVTPYYTTAILFNLVTWCYATILAFVSLRYRLPNQWGWTLNVHLFIIYVAAWAVHLNQFWQHMILIDSDTKNLDWCQSLIHLLPVFCGFDLIITTGTMKQGPPFIAPTEKHDNNATLNNEQQHRQVCNINVDSIFGIFFLNWCTKVVRTVARKKGLASDHDLPILTPRYRAENVYHEFGATRNNMKNYSTSSSLILRLIRCNGRALCLQGFLALISAWFWYIPAFFINRLLQFLQDYNDGVLKRDHPMQYGFLLVVGMGASLVVAGIVSGQQWYYSSCELQTRIRTMLNVEVYRKALRRRDLTVININSSSTTTSSNTKYKSGQTSLVPNSGSGSGALVNLMGTDASRVADFAGFWFPLLSAPLEMFLGIYFLYQLIGVSCFYGLVVMVFVLPINHFNSKLFRKTQEQLMKARDMRVSLMNEILLGIRQIKFFAWENLWTEKVMETRQAELDQLKVTYINGIFFQFTFQGAPVIVTLVSFFAFTKIFGNHLTPPIAFTVINVFNELRKALNVIPLVLMQAIQAYTSIRRIQDFLNEDEIDEISSNQIRNSSMDTDHDEEECSTGCNSSKSFILRDLNIQFPNNELSLISGATGSGKTLMLLALLGEAVILKGKALCPRVPVLSLVHDEDNDAYTASTNSSNTCRTGSTVTSGASENNYILKEEAWISRNALAYVSQTPWLQNASIRDNILFGLPFSAIRYQQTLFACALDKDLAQFDDGDLTEIGEKGVTLSGGQKARVALARAVYSRAQIVLMDDVLSAVDAHTAKHLYQQCLLGPLMKDRTRILVTHHIKLCFPGCSYLVHLNNGRAVFKGTKEELLEYQHQQQINKNKCKEAKNDDTSNLITSTKFLFQELAINAKNNEDDLLKITADEEEAIEKTLDQKMEEERITLGKKCSNKHDKINAIPRVLVEEETRASGAVKLRLYKSYLAMLGKFGFWSLLVVVILGARGFEIGESWWIKIWAQSYREYNGENYNATVNDGFIKQQYQSQSSIPDGVTHLNYYLCVYCLIAFGNVTAGAIRYAVLYYGSLHANRKLYASLLQCVFRAPLRFFDTTPIGRILNRFSKDFEAIDSGIPTNMMIFVVQLLMIISTAITICWVLPVMILPVIFMLIVNIVIGIDYINSSRELKRLDAVKRSPVFSTFTETIAGAATIRAYGATQRFFHDMMNCIDASVRPFYYSWAINHWISVRSYMSSATINFIASAFVIYNLGKMDVALAGFGLSFVLTFTDSIFWGIRHYTNLEMNFNSIERVVEFMEMDQEAAAITALRPPAQWPTHGQIEVQNLEVRYAPDLDPVLKNISFSIKPQEKVGIVGRTGSGKSTLALSFFRFVEASKGTIYIDGIDIKGIGTEDLRSNLTIIPQDPTLFSGTLRSNMDPFGHFDDESIFTAFRRVQLTTSNKSADSTVGNSSSSPATESIINSSTTNVNIFKDLTTKVAEGGKNFSQGQRQLLCLARALLKRSRIVLMDEATASVDFETDKAIQRTIATEFVDSTILCIAHRLHTVIDYDRILVLDQGQIVEFDNPLSLISDSTSVFHKMCFNSGEYDSLLELAKAKHKLIDA
ncbi:hypothetical protein BDF20DRAFT_617319 [Mycotypha africana]|uniref:uncharacterized protein n=1 Tax=Mycotypha africana TaxID=64632 RepID=UPI0023005D44|nr:uncharacterized protein BDF20DRAFT_617319 [Mycotypha africana]KAI8975591.1 hypothetical protein BDF20DRAFT_617319 [Mycotypha africana]